MGCKLIEPDIVKELREEEKQGILRKKNYHLNDESKINLDRFNDIELILELQNSVIRKFLFDIKQGKIKTSRFVVLTLNELSNYYNSDIWKVISEKISIDKQILSFYHLVNTYIEHLEQSFDTKDLDINKDDNYHEIMKLKNMILTLKNIKK